MDPEPLSHDIAALRKAAVAEAFTWLNTPYVDCGYVKGLKGAVDCAMILVGVYSAIGIVPKSFDPRPYNPDWHLHQTEELYRGFLTRYCRKLDPMEIPMPGDILMYKFGKHISHSAILVADDYIIHAHKRTGCVDFVERRALQHWYDSAWSPF